MSTIVVLVKQVPDTNAKIAVQGDRVDLSSVKMEMSPYDGFAIETALRHKEATGGTVTALTVGAAGTEKILKDAKAMGVDNIVRVWDDAWGELDSNALQSVLKESIESLVQTQSTVKVRSRYRCRLYRTWPSRTSWMVQCFKRHRS